MKGLTLISRTWHSIEAGYIARNKKCWPHDSGVYITKCPILPFPLLLTRKRWQIGSMIKGQVLRPKYVNGGRDIVFQINSKVFRTLKQQQTKDVHHCTFYVYLMKRYHISCFHNFRDWKKRDGLNEACGLFIAHLCPQWLDP